MKKKYLLRSGWRLSMLLGAWLGLSAAPAVPDTVTGFVHRTSNSNVQANWTVIDHPATNDDPEAILLVTPNYNPGNRGGTYVNHPIGVWYTNGKWTIFNQDQAAMPKGAAFNVLVVPRKGDLQILQPRKEIKILKPDRGTAPGTGMPARKVRQDGKVEIVYPDNTTVEVTYGMKKVTAPNGTERIQSQAQVPFSTPPVPADADTVRWLDHHNEGLLSVIRTLVSNDEASMSNYLRQEESLSLLGRIDKRGQTIQFLLTPP